MTILGIGTHNFTIQDLEDKYESLYREHLEVGGQSLLDDMLAFQRVMRYLMSPMYFRVYMKKFHE
jgi:hypothetical protein